jgi:hypothetical protein
MTIRTSSRTVIFQHPFVLDGLDEQQPAGAYEIETDDEQIEDVSFIAFRRVSTLIHLHPSPKGPGITQTLTVDPNELERALAHDREVELSAVSLCRRFP